METKRLQDLSFEALIGIVAKVIHSANRAYVDAIGGRAFNPTWEEYGESKRQDLINAIINTVKDPQTPQASHENWCVAMEKAGWSKDIKLDYNRKTHPNMVPYDQLPFEEQFKDQLYMGIASIFCAGLGILEMDEVVVAREIIMARMAEEHKLAVEDDVEATEKDRVVEPGDDPITTDKRKEEEPEQVINGVEKTFEPVMDNDQNDRPRLSGVVIDEVEKNGPDDPKPNLPADEGGIETPLPDVKQDEEIVGADEVGKETPLPSADEILANKPAEFTVQDVAEAVLGGSPPDDIQITETPDPKQDEEKETPAKPTTKKPAAKSSKK